MKVWAVYHESHSCDPFVSVYDTEEEAQREMREFMLDELDGDEPNILEEDYAMDGSTYCRIYPTELHKKAA